MVDRFLNYSLAHARPVYLFVQTGGALRRVRAVVTALDGERALCLLSARRKPVLIPKQDILAAGYVRGDSGESPDTQEEGAP